jgi:hypothetical protein
VDGFSENICIHDARRHPLIQPLYYEIDEQVVSVDQDAVDPDAKYVTLALTVDNVSEKHRGRADLCQCSRCSPSVLVDIVGAVATDNLVVNQMSDGNTLLVDSQSSLASDGALTGSEGGLLVTLKVDSDGKPNFTLATTTVG